MGFGRAVEAVVHLRKALDLMPDDAQAIFGLASALEEIGTDDAQEEADALHRRVIEEHPTAPFVEQSEKARTAYGQRLLKARSVGGFRPDVMMYMSDALQTFKRLGPQGTRAIALEVAMAGRNGLDINDSEAKYALKALPGKFSGLQMLSIMYAAFQQIDPTADIGADFKAEYEAAMKMQGM
jgi:tetratricopeptide (TPR) repeat protein